MNEPLPKEENFKPADPLVVHFDKARTITPSFSRLQAWTQGQILFIGDYWLTVDEARSLRDWLNKVLP